jgi:hypothetical protein
MLDPLFGREPLDVNIALPAARALNSAKASLELGSAYQAGNRQ